MSRKNCVSKGACVTYLRTDDMQHDAYMDGYHDGDMNDMGGGMGGMDDMGGGDMGGGGMGGGDF